MATINLGAIKFNWKGAYNSGTSYAVDDVVSSGGNSYVCIQAHSNQAVGNATAYWNIMSSAGTNGTNGNNGTDVGTTITTQGDILYRDGSGLARLPAGTSGQVLKTGGSGANPSWGTDAGGSILAVSHKSTGDTYDISTQNRTSNYTFTGNSYEISALTIAMTPSASTSKFMIQLHLQGGHESSYVGQGWLTYQVAGGTEYAIASSGTRGLTFRYDGADFGSSNAGSPSTACCVVASPATASAVTFRVRLATANSGHSWMINRSFNGATDTDDGGYMLSTMTVFELAGANSTVVNTNTNNTKT